MKVTRWFALLVPALLMLGGCATSRSVIDPKAGNAANPSEGPAVRIAKVEDSRIFQVSPPTPDIPSLSEDHDKGDNVQSRALGRKRNGFGRALGDVVLPEGKTVAGLTQGAITKAYRESGYRVLAPGEAGYDDAMPITAYVRQFWTWINMGAFALTVENKAEVDIQSPSKNAPSGFRVRAGAKESFAVVTESCWEEVVSKGLANLTESIKQQLKPASTNKLEGK